MCLCLLRMGHFLHYTYFFFVWISIFHSAAMLLLYLDLFSVNEADTKCFDLYILNHFFLYINLSVTRCLPNIHFPCRGSIKKKRSLIRFETIDSIVLGKSLQNFDTFFELFCKLLSDKFDADSQKMDTKIELSEQHLQHYRTVFVDVLIPFDRLKVDPISIGEGLAFCACVIFLDC